MTATYTAYQVAGVDRIFVTDAPTIWNEAIAEGDAVTDDATLTLAKTVDLSTIMTSDGVMRVDMNAAAGSNAGDDWALWLPVVIVTRASGVYALQSSGAPQAPASQGGATSATWTLTFAVTGHSLTITVKGAVGVVVYWAVVPAGLYNRAA